MSESELYMLKLYIKTIGMLAVIVVSLLGGFGVLILSVMKRYKEWPAVVVMGMFSVLLYLFMWWL